MDRLPRLGKRELIFLLSFTCNYVVSVRIGCVILLRHSLGLPYNYFGFTMCPCVDPALTTLVRLR